MTDVSGSSRSRDARRGADRRARPARAVRRERDRQKADNRTYREQSSKDGTNVLGSTWSKDGPRSPAPPYTLGSQHPS